MAGSITFLEIENYRSIHNKIHIDLPDNTPLVLIGENNAGKSNIIRALDLVMGEMWAGTHEPDDHEYWQRDPHNSPILVRVGLTGVYGKSFQLINGIYWKCSHDDKDKIEYKTFNSTYVNKEMLDQCTVVTLGADRRLAYQMSYTNKWTFLSKLMKRFHKCLISDEDRVRRLKESFENITDIFEEVPEFSGFRKGMQEQFESMIQNMTYKLSLDFSAYDPSNYFQSLRVLPVEGSEKRNFEELGTGEEQVLALAFAHAYAKAFHGGIVLVIEEPEAHLHPQAQTWLAKKILEFAKDGLQVVLTTHSPAFIDLLNLNGIVLVNKSDGATKATQLTAKTLAEFCINHGANSNKVNERTILPFYASHGTSDILSGLFSKKVILVEGQTEVFALKIFLEKVGMDVDKLGITIIPVLGKGNLAKWWRFFNAYKIPAYVIFDNDNENDKDCLKRFDILNTLHASDNGLIVNETDWQVNDKFSVFGIDFETTMKTYFDDYEAIEKIASGQVGPSKPLRARFVAEHLAINTGSKGYIKLQELKSKIHLLEVEELKNGNEVNLEFDDYSDENEEIPF